MGKNIKTKKNSVEELIKKFQDGDNEAFGEIVRRMNRYVFKTALRFLRSIEDAEDLTQEIFLKLYNSLINFEFRSDLKTYLYKMVSNAAAVYYKRKDRLKEKYSIMVQKEWQKEKLPDEKIEEEETLEDLENAIASLSKKYKEIILLKDFQQLSYKEISEKLNITENAAKMRHFHALKMLKSKFMTGK